MTHAARLGGSNQQAARIGVDVGGTFTDLVLVDGDSSLVRVEKGLTRHEAIEAGVLQLVASAGSGSALSEDTVFVHGTTVALNMLLERKGACVGLLVTAGFRDVLELRRGERARMYDLRWVPDPPLVQRYLRVPIHERMRADGIVELPLSPADVSDAAAVFTSEEVACVAICFLNAYRNPAHEREAARLLRASGFAGEISLSHEVSGEHREYERTSTTVIDAYVRPRVATYLRNLERGLRREGLGEDLYVTSSGGGAMSFAEARSRPFETIASGPAAGAVGAAELCRTMGIRLGIAADVGGTSFDTCLIEDGRPATVYEGRVAGHVIQAPWVDVRSIGAGGGSIASVDQGGLLRVGPESAGSDPGPVCYGLGGTRPTVTDAASVLGMLGRSELAGGVRLDRDAARRSLEPLADRLGLEPDAVAAGIISIACSRMADAIREVAGERGDDPSDAALIVFGGAGPLFATLLAGELDSDQAIVPVHPGAFSARGLLEQDLVRSAATSWVVRLADRTLADIDAVLDDLFARLEPRGSESAPVRREAALDLRYSGQDYTLTIPIDISEAGRITASASAVEAAFASAYERSFGHVLDGPVEVAVVRGMTRTPLRSTETAPAAARRGRRGESGTAWAYSFARGRETEFAVVDRSELAAGSQLAGPAIVVEDTATTYVDAGFTAEVSPTGTLLLVPASADLGSRERSSGGRAARHQPVLTEIVRQGLLSAAEQMKVALRRTAFSPIVYDMIDFCCALYDPDVRLLAQAQATPLFLGTMGHCVESCVRGVGGRSELVPGDVLFSTYAYDIGSHPQDAAIVVPAFLGDRLVAYAAVKAHHMDMGAKEPFCTDTTDNFQEGVIFPGVRLYRAGRRVDDIYRTLLANSRLPAALAGDLEAQIAAARAGNDAVLRLIARYGIETFQGAAERILDHGEATVRRFLTELPDGRFVAAGALDNDGVDDELVPFEVSIDIAGSDVVVDFTSAPDSATGPVNCPLPTTVSAARLAVLTIAGGGESANEGHFRPINVRTRPGSLFHPEPPAPIYLYGWPAAQAIDAIHAALADAVPAAVRAGSGGDFCGMVWWGTRPDGSFWASGTDHVTGQGARSDGDGGPPLMHISFSGMRNTPVETLELRYPMLVERFELAADSGGAGRFRGGLGLDIRYRMLDDARFTSPIERTRTPPWGLEGGEPGRPNLLRVVLPDGSEHVLRKTTAQAVPAGSVIEIEVGGGGGYGPALARDPNSVQEDLRDGHVTAEAARRLYPQACAGDGAVAGGGARAL
jgi:N-methylhydantoinase A/oxoprolinase/acetone carboxylase beta subunit/N-methylhydantoinase B/oxoprolinase/acetone carboxylase alpha subunit